MRVLVLEGDGKSSAGVVEELTAAGLEVARCSDEGGPAFPCNGLMAGRTCPLENHAVSAVVVTTQPEAHSDDLAPHEEGVRCALRQYIPVVLVGDQTDSPLAPYATTIAADADALLPALHEAVEARLPQHEAVATDMFRWVLDTHGLADVGASVRASRGDRGVRLTLYPSEAIPAKVAEVAGVRVAGAVRALDSHSPMFAVSVEVNASEA